MRCPDCGEPYQCSCRSCMKRRPTKWKRINMSDDGSDWNEVCPKCGKTESTYWWLKEQDRQYKEEYCEDVEQL